MVSAPASVMCGIFIKEVATPACLIPAFARHPASFRVECLLSSLSHNSIACLWLMQIQVSMSPEPLSMLMLTAQ